MNNKSQNLKLSFLGGVGEVGKNMTAIEYKNQIIVIDCGVMFPSEDMPGIDLVIPDTTYLKDNADSIEALRIIYNSEDKAITYSMICDLRDKLLAEDKLAIILGTEGDGLAACTISDCDYTVKIPMAHGVDSLNVAAASAIAFWELGRH